MIQKPGTEKHQDLIRRWVDSLTQIPAGEIIWLEGSLVGSERAGPGSDIDMRIAIADNFYEQLWQKDRTPLLKGSGEYLPIIPLNSGYVQVLTAEGIIVELFAYKTSEMGASEKFQWEFLFCRLPELPAFKKLPKQSAAETWPAQKTSVDDVRKWTNSILFLLAMSQSALYNRGEPHSAALLLDVLRGRLIEIMYRRPGVRHMARAKELTKIFPSEFISDIESSYTQVDEFSLDSSAIASALMRTFAILGKHLQVPSEQAGGGFEADWYYRLYHQIKDKSQSGHHGQSNLV